MESYKKIHVGEVYENFNGLKRIVTKIFEDTDGKIKIMYDDLASNTKNKVCDYGTFAHWTVKKQY